MTTLVDLRTDIRSHLDELTATFWEDAELNRWANEALRDVARRTEVLQKDRSYTIVADQIAYPFPEDMIRIYRVEYRQSDSYIKPLEYKSFQELDDIWYTSREVTGALPYFYSLWGYPGGAENGIYIYPIPSDTIADGLRAFYYGLPRTMIKDEDPAEIPAGWQDLVPLYAEYVARRKEAQDSRWREALELYEMRLKELHSVSRHWTDQQTSISADNRGLPFWAESEWSA